MASSSTSLVILTSDSANRSFLPDFWSEDSRGISIDFSDSFSVVPALAKVNSAVRTHRPLLVYLAYESSVDGFFQDQQWSLIFCLK